MYQYREANLLPGFFLQADNLKISYALRVRSF